jgi:hypothetical protein
MMEDDDGIAVPVEISPWSVHFALIESAWKSLDFLLNTMKLYIPPLSIYHVCALGNVKAVEYLLCEYKLDIRLNYDLLYYLFSRKSVSNSIYWNRLKKNGQELVYYEISKLLLLFAETDENRKKFLEYGEIESIKDLVLVLEWPQLYELFSCFF